MTHGQNQALDPSPFIESLGSDCPFRREAAALTLGGLGNPRAGRPLAGLLLREVASVEYTGEVENEDVLRAGSDAIRRLGATESLYAVIKAICALGASEIVERETVETLIDCVAEIGGPTAVREAADKVVRRAREQFDYCPGMDTVAVVVFDRLGLCGDTGLSTLRRLALAGPAPLRPLAEHALSMA